MMWNRCSDLAKRRRARRAVGLVLVLGLAGIAFNLPLSAQSTNAQTSVAVGAATEQNFGDYLAAHQKELAPFFTKNGETFVKVLVPVVLTLFGYILVIALLAGWAINIFLGRCFTAFFAPVYTKLRYAILYSSGELLLSFLFVGLLAFLIIAFPALVQSPFVFGILAVFFLVVPFAVHVAWVRYSFRTDLSVSAFFYLGVLVVHAVTILLTMAPVVGAQAPVRLVQFVDQNITPQLQVEVESTRAQLTAARQARDAAGAKIAALQAQVDQATTDQQALQKQIDEQKNSEAYLFSRIAQLRAKGNLPAARIQFADFMAKFPTGTMIDAVKTQLAGIDADLAAQDAEKKKIAADAAAATAAATADLLARANKGEVTLSEMRRALVGKSLVEVKQLFGLPTEVGSDRWGFGKQMINDPLTEKKTGLAVYFSAGVVQSVDYYYGTDPAK